MKKLDLGQTVRLLANIGVIAGIVFLAVELRQNNDLLVAQTSYAQFNIERERRMALVQNVSGLTEIFVKQRAGSQLSEVERVQLGVYHNDTLDMYRWQFREYQAGRLPDGFIDLRVWRDVWVATPGLRLLFETDRPRLDPAFVQFIEENVVSGR